jgi:tRNA(Ile)-lysidine synthase
MPAFLTARQDGAPALRWDAGEIRRYRGRLYALHPLREAVSAMDDGAASLELGPGCGRFALVAGADGGLCAARAAGPVLRFRTGGESLRPSLARPRKRLKDLCQEAGIVPWMRERLPLVFVGGQLVAVADLWIDADFAAEAGSPALKPVWTGRPQIY